MRLTLGTRTVRRLTTLAGTGVLAVGLAAAGVAGSASAGTHHPSGHAAPPRPAVAKPNRVNCIPDNDGDCLQTVKGTVEATAGLHIRSGPGTGYSIVGTMPYLSTGTVVCWASGTNVNGNSYWDDLGSAYGSGYVADYYLYTGGNITGQVDPC
jgi:hypothetical protein